MEPLEALRQLGGSASRRQLLRLTSRSALEEAVRRAEIDRVGRGAFVLPDLPDPLKTAIAHSGTLSHASAADYWRMNALFPPTKVHLSVARRAHRRPERSVQFHYADLDGDKVTSALRTVLDCARTMPFREALAIADSALRLELITPGELANGADVLRGPGTIQARRVAALADGDAANPFESALRAIVLDVAVGAFVPQLEVEGTGYRVDLGDPVLRIVLEADSFAHHGGRANLESDCRRYDELVRRGWLVLRFSWEQVMFDEAWVAGVILDCCRLRNDRRGGKKGRIEAGRRRFVD